MVIIVVIVVTNITINVISMVTDLVLSPSYKYNFKL